MREVAAPLGDGRGARRKGGLELRGGHRDEHRLAGDANIVTTNRV